MIAATGVVVALLGTVVALVAHLSGRRMSVNALLWKLETNPTARRQMLERLAKLEGVKLVGHE